MTKSQRNLLIILVVVLLLLIFLFIYFRNRRRGTGEKCPDGRDIPTSGNCADNPPLFDAQGNAVVTPTLVDENGCSQPASYVVNSFPLSVGMKGDLVKQVQIRLNSTYGANLTEDGYFGCKTLSEVIKAFKTNSIDAELFKISIQGTVPVFTGSLPEPQ